MKCIIIIAAVLILAMYLLIAFSKGKDKAKSLKGETGIALTEINGEDNGRVKINGAEYMAVCESAAIPKSAKVEVKDKKGEKLVVEAIRF